MQHREVFMMVKFKYKQSIYRTLLLGILILFAVITLFPFIWILFTSIKPEPDIVTFPPRLLPWRVTLEAYVNIWSAIPFALYFRNTVFFACGVTAISLLFDSFAAYSFARLSFPGKNILFMFVLATLMIPFQVTMIPIFALLSKIGWLNTFAALIVPRASNAFGIFFLRQFFQGIPVELEEAAYMDGASVWCIYRRVIMPMSKPALITLAIFHFMYNWNDFLWPLIMTTSVEMRTLPTGLALFMGRHIVEYALLMAGVVLSLIPITIAYFAAQKYFVEGIALTGIKG